MNGTASGTALMHEDLTREIIGAFFDVYNELGFGFLESVYQRAMLVALKERGLDCESEIRLVVHYRGIPVGDFRADILVERKVILELKSVEKLHPFHDSQVLNYLKATRMNLGLLLNFGPKASFRRLILSPRTEQSATIRP